jgi:hypothetical protein
MSHLQAKLPNFIAYALHRTKLPSSVTFAALVLLQRLKAVPYRPWPFRTPAIYFGLHY